MNSKNTSILLQETLKPQKYQCRFEWFSLASACFSIAIEKLRFRRPFRKWQCFFVNMTREVKIIRSGINFTESSSSRRSEIAAASTIDFVLADRQKSIERSVAEDSFDRTKSYD